MQFLGGFSNESCYIKNNVNKILLFPVFRNGTPYLLLQLIFH